MPSIMLIWIRGKRKQKTILWLVSTLEIHFLFFMNEFREGTYTPLWGVRNFPAKAACSWDSLQHPFKGLKTPLKLSSPRRGGQSQSRQLSTTMLGMVVDFFLSISSG